jgi:dTDP-4-amino-4,6-dideoxygalactose transaminase
MQVGMTNITIRAVWPELPEPREWVSLLDETKHLNWHTNFGPLARRFEGVLQSLYAESGQVAVSTSNATSGLSACLIAHRIRGPVVCPAFTFQATACAILGAGCQPVIVDVDPVSGVVSPETLDAALQQTGAQAAILLSPYGFTTDFRAHAAVCERLGARLIIDSAAGLGVARDPALTGLHIDEVYSLHATKPFGIGEGGVIFTDPAHEGALRSAMNFGLTTHSATGQDQAAYWGVNGKLPEVGAAIGLTVATTMASRVSARQKMAAEWLAELAGTGVRPFCTQPELAPWQVFPVILPDEPSVIRLMANLAAEGIEMRRYYAPSLGACKGMRALHPCPGAQHLAARAVALPMRSFMEPGARKALMQQTKACIDASLQGISA